MLNQPANFRRSFGADLIVWTAYQMAKTPVLPLFAASLGAGKMTIGTIVSVSTVTGMVLKPAFGALSDRWGRKLWFFVALAFFAGTPFLYQFVQTPDELLLLRLFHGTATAIFGPVTLAFIAEMDRANRATRLGWFEIARETGYLIAPALAGWMLTFMPPERVFTVVGLVSCVAFIPAAFIDFDAVPLQRNRAERQSLWRQLANGFRHVASRARLWLAASLETAVFIVTYGLKAFLPLFAIQEAGFEVWVAGLFFTVQEAAHLATRPVGGRLGDRVGYLPTVAGGMATLAAMLLLLPGATTATALLALAVLGGIGQGLIFPSTIAMVGDSVAPGHMGLGMGVYGMFKNLGKVAGPVIAGALLEFFSYATVFTALAWFILATAAGLALAHRYRQRPVEQRL